MPVFEKPAINIAFRVKIALGTCAFFFFLILMRLWFLQVLNGSYFREESENNRLRTVYVAPPRGRILDRGGEVLAKSRPSFNIELVKEDAPSVAKVLDDLGRVTGYEPEELKEKMALFQRKRRRFEPRLVLQDVSSEVVAKVSVRLYSLPGVAVNVVPSRDYIYGDFASHVLGHIGEISQKQLESAEFTGYRMGDVVGKDGVERMMERFLQGKRGIRNVIVNAAGVRTEDSQFEPARSGHNIFLTLDYDVQRAAEEALKDKEGAVVAMDPRSGEILAMVSKPAYDPNIFTSAGRGDRKTVQSFNKAIQGTYAPGSVFKFIMAAAALSESVMTSDSRVSCGGSYRVGRSRRFYCWKKSGHGSMNVREAIRSSCNVYFYTVGQRLGVDRIHDYATRFGLGRQLTGIDLPWEKKGLVPSTAWKKAAYRKVEDKKWYPGETPSVSIGQGATIVTPLQVVRALSALVNGGKLLKPYVVKRVRAEDGEFDDEYQPEVVGKTDIEPWIEEEVIKGLEAVVNEKGGTAARARLDPKKFNIKVGGKTGTAQRRSSSTLTKHKLEDNAWFAGFAPVKEARIVVAAIVVGGGHGGSSAAPVVRQVMEAYFSKYGKNSELITVKNKEN